MHAFLGDYPDLKGSLTGAAIQCFLNFLFDKYALRSKLGFRYHLAMKFNSSTTQVSARNAHTIAMIIISLIIIL